MTDLECLQAELDRQDREFASTYEQLADIDPELLVAVCPTLMDALATSTEISVATPSWALRV